jgi:iduronate 2-sulfatase
MQVSLPRPHQCYTPDQQFWDMYPDDLPLPPDIDHDASHRPAHFQAEVKDLKTRDWLIEPKTREEGCRRVWQGYLACITQVDHALGQLLDHLSQNGLDQNTLVVYTSDHGAYSGTFGVREKAPGICSEAVCRVPLICRVPGVTKKGHVCKQLVESIDVTATLATLCSLEPMDWVDGGDITAQLGGSDEPIKQVAVTENVWSKAMRWGPWRFVHYQPKMFDGQDVGELYHLEDDPREHNNLYHDPDYQATVQQCRLLLLEWLIGTTRPTTVWPLPTDRSPLACDGKESNTAGAGWRIEQGFRNYI